MLTTLSILSLDQGKNIVPDARPIESARSTNNRPMPLPIRALAALGGAGELLIKAFPGRGRPVDKPISIGPPPRE